MTAECEWKDDGEGNWNSSCGECWTLIDGTPKDNRMRFCCYCGKPLREFTPEQSASEPFEHGRHKDWKWWCQSCGTLTNDGECDCTRVADCADRQHLIRNP